MDLSETDIAWLAGLLEGEGNFSPAGPSRSGGKSVTRGMNISLSMSDRDVVERAAKMMGVECKPVTSPTQLAMERDRGWSPMFRARAYGENARRTMRLVLKHMGERRTQKILESLEDWT